MRINFTLSLWHNNSIDRTSKLEYRPNTYTHSYTADLLSELLQCKNGILCLSESNFSSSDVSAMIDIQCTC